MVEDDRVSPPCAEIAQDDIGRSMVRPGSSSAGTDARPALPAADCTDGGLFFGLSMIDRGGHHVHRGNCRRAPCPAATNPRPAAQRPDRHPSPARSMIGGEAIVPEGPAEPIVVTSATTAPTAIVAKVSSTPSISRHEWRPRRCRQAGAEDRASEREDNRHWSHGCRAGN